MTSAPIRNSRGENTGREGKAIWSERQRTGVMWPQAKGNGGVLAASRSWRRQEGVSLGCIQGAQPFRPFTFRPLASRTMREYFLFF